MRSVITFEELKSVLVAADYFDENENYHHIEKNGNFYFMVVDSQDVDEPYGVAVFDKNINDFQTYAWEQFETLAEAIDHIFNHKWNK